MSSKNRLSDYQKNIIKYLFKKGKTPEEIREDDELKRENGSKILLGIYHHY